MIEGPIATTQLLACGVLAAAMVNRTGYPDRPAFDAFIKKYRPAGLPKMPEATPAGQAPGGRRASIAGRRSAAEHQNESILRVKDLCKRPFPFGYGLKELTDRFAVSTIENKIESDHTKPLHQRMKVRQVACITKPAKEDEPVPAHDFTVGIERVFFAPGILHKIATVLHPKIQKALKTVITLQCAARVMSSKGKLKKRMFDEKLRAERRRQAELKRLAEEEEAAKRKAEFEKEVAEKLSAESAALMMKAQAAAESALETQYRSKIDGLNDEITSWKDRHAQDMKDKHDELSKLRELHEGEKEDLSQQMEDAADAAAKALAEAQANAADELEATRKAIMASNEERARKVRVANAEEVAAWRGLAQQRAAVEQSMMEEIATEMVACVAEWRRIRKNIGLGGKLAAGMGMDVEGRSKDGQAELAEVLIKQGKTHAVNARLVLCPLRRLSTIKRASS